jgi:hypothetical protein
MFSCCSLVYLEGTCQFGRVLQVLEAFQSGLNAKTVNGKNHNGLTPYIHSYDYYKVAYSLVKPLSALKDPAWDSSVAVLAEHWHWQNTATIAIKAG